jgi:ribosome-associated toxin RatA of RatAB toxin-antitoxin module
MPAAKERQMSEYEQSLTMQASPQAVFDFVSNVQNLPHFMPTTQRAQALEGEQVRVEG